MGILGDLYQAAVLEHSRRPRNRYRPDRYDLAYPGVNPGCGDEITLYLALDDGRVATVAFEGEGCAISQASASLMTEAVRGRTARPRTSRRWSGARSPRSGSARRAS